MVSPSLTSGRVREASPAGSHAAIKIVFHFAFGCEACVPGGVIGSRIPGRPAQLLHKDVGPGLDVVIKVSTGSLDKQKAKQQARSSE